MADPKLNSSNSLPSPVQTLRRGRSFLESLTKFQITGPPPSGMPHSYQNSPTTDWSEHPQWNYIRISRTFGALRRCRYTVDPNLHVPSSLLGKPEWEPSECSVFSSLRSRPDPNLELAVTFGHVDAEIHILPLSANARQCAIGECRTASRLLYSRRLDSCQCPRKSNLEFSTSTGNVTLRVEAAPTAHFSLRASSTFGHICIFLPRTFHGPLNVMSSLGAPKLSPELKRVCAPISEVGGARRWFVGNASVWRDHGEHGDEASAGGHHVRPGLGRVYRRGGRRDACATVGCPSLGCEYCLGLRLPLPLPPPSPNFPLDSGGHSGGFWNHLNRLLGMDKHANL
ncbi:hypothetical protein C8R47DRAFT_1022736 [Mycena vitilis]|nr:hypothetical protein C8R47DRAFT_1022736 [Mycena vitilis]